MHERIITLIRHGQPLAGTDHDDPDLSAVGQQQASLTGEALKSAPPGKIYFSPLLRARRTAQLIAAHHPHAQPVPLDTLKECVPTIPPLFSTFFQSTQKSDAAAAACRERLDAASAEIFQPATDARAHDLVVCHGNVIRYLVCHALNLDPHAWVLLTVAHCGICQIAVAPRFLQALADTDTPLRILLCLNETRHLPADLHTL